MLTNWTGRVLVAALWATCGVGLALGQDRGFLGDDEIGAPLRIPDLTFPSFLVLDMAAMPAAPLGQGNWALELNSSLVNNYQVSPAAEDYLRDARGGARRRLDASDVEGILALPDGDAFFIDAEFVYTNLAFHYGVTDRLDLGIRVNHIAYGTGQLDGSIFDFHEQFDFGQQGRTLVPDHLFQVVLGAEGLTPIVALDRPSAGGLGDPSLVFRYAFSRRPSGWRFGISGGVKAPLADVDDVLSTGSWDAGLQLNFDKRWRRTALIANLGVVAPGTYEQNEFDPPVLPSFRLSVIRKVKAVRLMLQTLVAEHPFREVIDSDLTELEFQLTFGVKWNTSIGVFGLGLTENLLNHDNTPDIGLHFSWGYLAMRN